MRPTPPTNFPRMPIDLDDGYIHFSTAAQLAETLRLYFAGQSDLAVFAVSTYALGASLRWEPSRGGQLFPHGYGDVPATLVGQTASVSVATDGVGYPAGLGPMIFSALSPLLRVPLLASLTRDSLLRMDPEIAHGATINALRLGLAPEQD